LAGKFLGLPLGRSSFPIAPGVYIANELVSPNEVRRFGFHNFRRSPASFLTTKKKTDVKTIQHSLRHAENTTTLDKYVQTDMAELVAAQELMFDAIFQNRSAAVT
jgi:integrase